MDRQPGRVRHFVASEAGLTAVEYVGMLALIILLAALSAIAINA